MNRPISFLDDQSESSPVAEQIISAPNVKDEEKSRQLLNHVRRQHALGEYESAIKYLRRILDKYSHTAAGGDAKLFLEDWKTSEPFREWTDSTGKHKTIAKFVRLDRGSVYLMNKTNIEIAVELRRLSAKDQRYVLDREGLS